MLDQMNVMPPDSRVLLFKERATSPDNKSLIKLIHWTGTNHLEF